jgi:hypothetical protein
MSNLVKYNNKILKKITNVYQCNYKNAVAQGFGDYLNGCFFLFQICNKHSLIFDIDFSNHPLAKHFIIKNTNNIIDYENISYYNIPLDIRKNKILLYNTFISHLNNITDEEYYLFCNFEPLYTIQNMAPEYMKNNLIPNIEIENNVNLILKNFNLIPYTYDIIHIRSGDKYLLSNNNLDNFTIKKYVRFLTNFVDINKKYLILSDNINLKKALKNIKIFPNFYIDDLSEICHTGENSNKTEDQLKNTIIDFFLISKSKNVISISLLSRGGTGFSRLCSQIFNIPYTSLLIDLGNHV